MSCPGVFSFNKCCLILHFCTLNGLEHIQVGKPAVFWVIMRWKERTRKHFAWCPWYIWSLLSIKSISASALWVHKLWPSVVKLFEGWPSTYQDSEDSKFVFSKANAEASIGRVVTLPQDWGWRASPPTPAVCLSHAGHINKVLSNPAIRSPQDKHFEK